MTFKVSVSQATNEESNSHYFPYMLEIIIGSPYKYEIITQHLQWNYPTHKYTNNVNLFTLLPLPLGGVTIYPKPFKIGSHVPLYL